MQAGQASDNLRLLPQDCGDRNDDGLNRCARHSAAFVRAAIENAHVAIVCLQEVERGTWDAWRAVALPARFAVHVTQSSVVTSVVAFDTARWKPKPVKARAVALVRLRGRKERRIVQLVRLQRHRGGRDAFDDVVNVNVLGVARPTRAAPGSRF